MGAIVRGQHAENLAPGLIMHTFSRYRERPEIYRMINKVRDSARAFEQDFAISGFGPLVEKTELGRTTLDKPFKLGGVQYFHKGYALGFLISEEMRDDDQYGLITELSGELGRSARYTAELWGHDVYNNAFSNARYAGRDGLALCHTAHPIKGTGTTFGNRPAVDVDLSMAALEAAYSNFSTQLDDRGIPIELMPTMLIIHPSQTLFATQVLQSPGVSTASHEGIINPIQGWVRIVPTPYLVDTDAWFLITNTEDSAFDVRFWWRKKPETKTWDDDDADGTIHKIKQRHSVGFGDWRGVYGSPGA